MPELDSETELRKFVAPEFIFGAGARHLAGRYARNWKLKRILLVTDPGVQAAGWTAQVARSIEAEGIEVVLFTGLSSNPRDIEVMAGAEVYRREGCRGLAAVGGGSVIDTAKCIGIVATNEGHILDYQGVDQITVPMPPLICVPTTGGSSADVSQFAIVNNVAEQVKVAIVSKALVPDVSLIDPETLRSMSPYLSACTGIDALVHAIEAYVSNAAGPLTDLHAMEAIRLLRAHLAASIAEPDVMAHRTSVMLGSLEAGLAFSNASLGCVHALAHTLGGYLDLSHGECNALLLPHVVAFNFGAAPQRYRRIAEALGCDVRSCDDRAAAARLRDHLQAFLVQLGITGSLRARGVSDADITPLAEKAIHDPCNATNPRPPTAKDLKAILQEAL